MAEQHSTNGAPASILEIARMQGATNSRGFTMKGTRALALRAGRERVNRHFYEQSASIARLVIRKRIMRSAAGGAAREHLKSIPLVPLLTNAAKLHGYTIAGLQYRIRRVET